MIKIKKSKIEFFIKTFMIAIYLFASLCFWEHSKLNIYMLIGIAIMICSGIMAVFQGVSLKRIYNDKAVLWVVSNFALLEYGIPVMTSDIDVCNEICGDLKNVRMISNDISKVDLKKEYETLLAGIPYEKQGKFSYQNTVRLEEKLIKGESLS